MQAEMSDNRWDPAHGVRARVAFFGPEPLRLFGCTHTGVGASTTGVVVCPPLHAELMTNYRNEVILADALAARGVAVQRFQYRGTGNSDGESREVTFGGMLHDAIVAAARLREVSGAGEVIFLGTRFGALIAAAAARLENAPVALWEPVVDAATYFREVFRAQLIYDLKRRGSGRISREALVDDLRRYGRVDILGYSVGQAFYESSIHRTLQEPDDRLRRILLVQFSMAGTLRHHYTELRRHWVKQGAQVDAHVVSEAPTWGFFSEQWEPQENRPQVRRLVSLTADWVVEPQSVYS
jgi:hypothetical protein